MRISDWSSDVCSSDLEETVMRPKPMVEIGGRPIIWHIMKIYAHHGFDEFIVLAGYKAEVIKLYFLNYASLNSDFRIDLASGEVTRVRGCVEQWKVTVLDPGNDTMTGGRLKRARDVIGRERFLLTYGDGLAAVDLRIPDRAGVRGGDPRPGLRRAVEGHGARHRQRHHDRRTPEAGTRCHRPRALPAHLRRRAGRPRPAEGRRGACGERQLGDVDGGDAARTLRRAAAVAGHDQGAGLPREGGRRRRPHQRRRLYLRA